MSPIYIKNDMILPLLSTKTRFLALGHGAVEGSRSVQHSK